MSGLSDLELGARVRYEFAREFAPYEWLAEDTLDGRAAAGTGGRQVYLAVTALGLYGSWGIAGGPAFPLSQQMDGPGPVERVRFAVNVTFWW